jgi:TM2 domain-containing membrane protein YozV
MTRHALVAAALLAAATSARAQQRPRAAAPTTSSAPPAATSMLCPAPRPRPAATAEQRRAARDLAQRAQQAAILGDRAAAREQLRQAAMLDPRDPDLAYQLARANDAAGAAADAASEYCRFLSLAPNGPEATEARDRVAILAPPARAAAPGVARLSPTRALSLGLLGPGAGQMYTGRPVAGVLAFGGAAAAVACAASQHTSVTSVQETAVDPFGNPYTYTARRQTSSRPCLVPGLAAAGAIAVTSAIEAFNHARHANDERRIAVDLYPDGTTLALRVTVR